MLALVLAAALAQATDGGLDPIYDKCPDGPPIVPVMPCAFGVCGIEAHEDGGVNTVPLEWPWEAERFGYLMADTRARRIACMVGACEADRENKTAAIDQTGGVTPPWYLWVFGVAGALAAGAAFDHWVLPLIKP